MDLGFDHFFGFLDGFSDHFAGSRSYRLDRLPFTDFGPGYYSSTTFTDRAVRFVQSPPPGPPGPAGEGDKPFFLYLSYQAPHNPLQAPRAEILNHRGRYGGGWQAVREARFRRQKALGIVPVSAALPASPRNLPAWDSLTPEQRDLEDLRMSVYAAMVEQMDRGIGRVLQALRDSGKADNTLILFLSDNGTDPFSVVDAQMLRQGKLPGDRGSNWQPGTGWAYASVTPWRLYKISQHGGGVTTGAIAWWPGGLGGRPGRVEAAPVHLVDLLPTLMDAANVAPPTVRGAGESFLPLLNGGSWKRTGPLYFQYADNRAHRTGEWTQAEVDGAGGVHLRTVRDPLEAEDVAARHPEIVADLDARWRKWWRTESGKPDYVPDSTKNSPHYKPQGDRGSGTTYSPSAMPASLASRYPVTPRRP
jgi:arylsulfatase